MTEKEKLIDEMAKAVKEQIHENCSMAKVYEALYTAGYRKQREGRWTPRHKETKAFCSKCGALRDIETQEFWSFCPNCGAKMKGGAE